MMLNKQKIAKAVNAVSVCVLAFFGLVLLYFGTRVFVCDKYPVSTTSMTPTIIPGDQILVNKLVFGARIYKNLKFLQGDSLETFRIPGFRKIRHNDVVVFNFPFGNDDWQKIEFRINRVFAKRCLGLPGDTLSVVNGFYRNPACRDTLGYYDNEAAFSATPDSLIDPVILRSAPFDEKYGWTTKNFGPLYIPRTGDRIRLDARNHVLYRLAVGYETGNRLEVRDSVLYLGDFPVDEYTFTENYYFMGGDNVANSQDSRYFGFIPEKFIVGVATRIAYSRDKATGKLRWNRLMKAL